MTGSTGVAARSTWEIHARERILDAALAPKGGAWILDAGGHAQRVDGAGAVTHRAQACEPPLLAGCRLRADGWLVATPGEVLAIGDDGSCRWRHRAAKIERLAAGAAGLAAATRDGRLVVLSHGGREKAALALGHDVAGLAFASRRHELVAVGGSGHVTCLRDGGVAWRINFRIPIAGLCASLDGVFAIWSPPHGIQLWNVDGSCLGVLDPPEAAVTCALAPAATQALVATAAGELLRVELPSGDCTWRERRPHRLAALRLGEGAGEALVVAAAGAVEHLRFGSSVPEHGRLVEPLARRDRAPGLWRRPAVVVPDAGTTARLAVAPTGGIVAIASEGLIRLHDARGAVVERHPASPSVSALVFGPEGSLVAFEPEALSLGRIGRPRWERVRGRFARILPAAPGLLATLRDPPRVILLDWQDPGATAWACDLPSRPDLIAAMPDGRVAVACETGLACIEPTGKPGWIRAGSRPRSLAADDAGFVLAEDDRIVRLGPGGDELWRAGASLELFGVDGRACGRSSDNRFALLDAEGLQALDRTSNLGRSFLVAGRGGLREINFGGRILTCFDLEGAILWRSELPDVAGADDFACAGGLLALRAGSSACWMPVDAAGEDAAGRATFLEV